MDKKMSERIALLTPLLKDCDQGVRLAAADSIERLERIISLDDTLLALKNGDTATRIRAIYALSAIGGEVVVKPLVYCAGRPEEDIRSAAVEALGMIRHPQVVPVLLERLADESNAVQARAIAAVSGFPPTLQLLSALRPFLARGDGFLDGEAALALGRMADVESVAAIISLLNSPHPFTRKCAVMALSLLPQAGS